MDQQAMRALLESVQTIAVVGISSNPDRSSYGVAQFLQQQGYHMIPVNPGPSEILGQRTYPDLLSVPEPIDLVNIFRRPEHVGPHVDEAIQRGVKAIWMQLGIVNEEAAERARAAVIQVVMDRCIAVEYRLLRVQRGKSLQR